MKRFAVLFIFIFSLQVFAQTFSKSKINYIVIDSTAKPFQIDEHSGLITDIFDEISKRIYGRGNTHTVSAPFLRALKTMRENDSYKWVSYGAKEWNNIQSKNLSKEALFKVNHKILTKKGFKYKSISDLFGKRLVLIKGFAYPGIAKYIKSKKIEVLIVNSHNSAIRAIEIGRADAFPEIKIRAMYHMNKGKFDKKKFQFHDFKKYIKNYFFYLSFSSGMKNEIPKFDREIRKLRKENYIKKIISKYLR